jgi:hypothetical protein
MFGQLSSSVTIYYKWVIPVFLTAAGGVMSLGMWTGRFDPLPVGEKLALTCLWLLASCDFIWFGRRLKHVLLRTNYLIVIDYQSQVRVPLSHINKMSESRMVGPKRIRVHLSPGCQFGDKIVFIPRLQFHNPFREHPAITKLRNERDHPANGLLPNNAL